MLLTSHDQVDPTLQAGQRVRVLLYRMPISHVSGCLQDRRVFHEVITLITREALLRDVHGGMKVCGVRRELSVERLGSCRSIYRELHMSRISCVEASPWRAERPRVRMWSEQKGQPCTC